MIPVGRGWSWFCDFLVMYAVAPGNQSAIGQSLQAVATPSQAAPLKGSCVLPRSFYKYLPSSSFWIASSSFFLPPFFPSLQPSFVRSRSTRTTTTSSGHRLECLTRPSKAYLKEVIIVGPSRSATFYGFLIHCPSSRFFLLSVTPRHYESSPVVTGQLCPASGGEYSYGLHIVHRLNRFSRCHFWLHSPSSYALRGTSFSFPSPFCQQTPLSLRSY
ncbi:hypothetical protein GGR50DRAFT_377439 [Xylaria sp. CBS 124048]|nr:hypothetical protein GGR50DRAFT_377439 [Xylaria sp. CBS 124048]